MRSTFFEEPILNSPYAEPARHHSLDEEGQPTDNPPVDGRRPSALLSPVPKSRKRRAQDADNRQQTLGVYADDGVSSEEQEYNPTPVINDIRTQMKLWRSLPNPQDWGVTPRQHTPPAPPVDGLLTHHRARRECFADA